MTDTENKNEQAAAKDTVDTAPYMKKDSTPESSKSNIVIPLVLLVVSAIVIFATFYKEEYNNLVAGTDSESESAEVSPDQTATDVTDDKTDVIVIAEQSEDANSAPEETVTIIAEESSEPVVDTTPAGDVGTANADTQDMTQQQTANDDLTMQTQAANNSDSTQSAYRSYPYRPNIQNPAKSHTQEQAQKYNEVMQQRRQAYEREMEARRQQFEASMKAQQKKREALIQAQKAEFQRMEQSSLETAEKIQALHNQISELHKEIHQLMLQSRPPRVNPAAE
jgi:hypothetical protein